MKGARGEAFVIAELQRRVDAAGGVRAFAKRADFSPSYISDVLLGRRRVADRLAGKLGYEIVKLYRIARPKL